MPEALTKSEVDRGQDPSVTKQWDDQASLQEKYKDFEAIADKVGVCIMGTFRPGIGVGVASLSTIDLILMW